MGSAGLGGRPNSCNVLAFGVAVKDRGAVMDESLGIVRALLEQERVTHKGEHFTLDNLTVTPQGASAVTWATTFPAYDPSIGAPITM